MGNKVVILLSLSIGMASAGCGSKATIESSLASSASSFSVMASGDGNEIFAPNVAQTVQPDGKGTFTLNPNSGYTVVGAVGGTCPIGYWSGNTYTTDPIAGDCKVNFAANTGSSGSGFSNHAQVLPSSAVSGRGVPQNWFGEIVAISGNTMAISSRFAVTVYHWNGTSWVQQAILLEPDGKGAVSQFGSVAVDDATSTIVVGALGHDVGSNAGQGVAYVYHLSGGTWSETAELTASDGAAGDTFGASVAISGSTIVVGAETHKVGGNSSQGAVYVYNLSGGTWSQTAELTSSDGTAADYFGTSVAIDGTTIVVGAHLRNVSFNFFEGDAYVYNLSGGVWSQTAELTASDGAAGDFFGYSVSISGSTIVVGSPFHKVGTNSNQGAAYVYTLSGTWAQTAELTAADGASGDGFGFSARISGSTILVGSASHQVGLNPGQGAAYVFGLSGTWSQTAELTASDGGGFDYFGAIGIDGSTIVVGAYGHIVGNNTQQGAAYVYNLSGTWTQTQELTSGDGTPMDAAGTSVAIDGTLAVVGVPGHTGSFIEQGEAIVYKWNGSTWTAQATLVASDAAFFDDFGYSVAISGSTIVVGARWHKVGSQLSQGAAYVFTLSNGTWTQTAELTASDGAANDQLGSSVAISDSTIVLGAPGHKVGSNANQGAAYVFAVSGGAWSQTAELTSADGAASDAFGYSAAISGSTIGVGALAHKVGGNASQGAIYVFALSAGTWSQSAELTASDGGAMDNLGATLALDGSTLISGARHAVGGHSGQGAVYVFTNNSGWTQSAELVASDGVAQDYFGKSVAISGTTILAGSLHENGEVYTFTLNSGVWSQVNQWSAPDANTGVGQGENFGASVALSRGVALIGAPNEISVANNYAPMGASYFFW